MSSFSFHLMCYAKLSVWTNGIWLCCVYQNQQKVLWNRSHALHGNIVLINIIIVPLVVSCKMYYQVQYFQVYCIMKYFTFSIVDNSQENVRFTDLDQI